MDLPSIYQGPLSGLGALVFIFYQQKILQLNLLIQIAVMFIKIGVNIILAALMIWTFYGTDGVYWMPITKSAVIMQVVCAGVQIGWRAYKK